MYNLRRTKIKHLDLMEKNLCINKKGELSLIDFDIAAIKNRYLSREIQKRAVGYGKSINYYKELKQLCIF